MGISAFSLDVGSSSLGRKIKKFREHYQHLISAVRYKGEGRVKEEYHDRSDLQATLPAVAKFLDNVR